MVAPRDGTGAPHNRQREKSRKGRGGTLCTMTAGMSAHPPSPTPSLRARRGLGSVCGGTEQCGTPPRSHSGAFPTAGPERGGAGGGGCGQRRRPNLRVLQHLGSLRVPQCALLFQRLPVPVRRGLVVLPDTHKKPSAAHHSPTHHSTARRSTAQAAQQSPPPTQSEWHAGGTGSMTQEEQARCWTKRAVSHGGVLNISPPPPCTYTRRDASMSLSCSVRSTVSSSWRDLATSAATRPRTSASLVAFRAASCTGHGARGTGPPGSGATQAKGATQ